ncbi:MAG: hypothetical protein ABL959_16775 [Pyrinomonadaceae bacterium]
MNTHTKIYIGLALATLTIATFIFSSIWTTRKFTKLERETRDAKQAVQTADKLAAEREIEAAVYKKKLEYLENNLSEIQTIARKQDEELEKLNINSRDARNNVERTRRIRTIDTTAGELCAKLAEIGRGCD